MSLNPHKAYSLSPIPGAETLADGSKAVDTEDWVGKLELAAVSALHQQRSDKLKVLVLYGSLRERSFSKLMAYEASRILHRIGCEVRVYDPSGLPVKDDVQDKHPKVQELRDLSIWRSVRPTQGRILGFAQVNGGSQSFNTVNTLRILGRWMRMFVIPNQSSLPLAWKNFTPAGRLKPSANRDRLVDVCEELVKVALIIGPHMDMLNDRYSEREETREKGRLLTQAEKEAEKDKVVPTATD
ncbi:hypothetical protein QFC21_005723 [Naganishia friedmannii]|uniref:Uncharacterized protein n=1 Tax=Naganishia friedmannii TaxID=89922 RepID=A0ACC2V8D8_9TREE|nr:hypothetical protein QFC21_005723 [Naganishia friedmannii]